MTIDKLEIEFQLNKKLIDENNDLKLLLSFHEQRIELVNKIKHNFPEPLLTAICDILANRALRPELKYLLKKE